MPSVSVIEGHSYVNVEQCLSNFLGMDHYPANITSIECKAVKNIIDSNIAKQVLSRAIKSNPNVKQEDILVILGLQWSDDFEPNGSRKSNRGSVWIKTVTFISGTLVKMVVLIHIQSP